MFKTRVGSQLKPKKLQKMLFKKWPELHFFVFGNIVSIGVNTSKQDQRDIELYVQEQSERHNGAFKVERLPF